MVERSAAILRAIASHGSAGIRLLDLAKETGISRPSVHRILQELGSVGFVEQNDDKTYTLGSALYLLGMSAPAPAIDLASVRPLLHELAEISGDTVYFATRQFDGVHYLLRVEGSHPVKALLVEVGDTKPYTSSYAGLALLAGLSEGEQARAIQQRRFDVPEGWHGTSDVAGLLRSKLVEVTQRGFCGGSSVVYPGIAGMAAPVPNATGAPLFAVSISAPEDRLTPSRIDELAPSLLATAVQIAQLLDAESSTQ